MKNQCFIHKTKPLILFNETLDLFFFGKRKISFGICRSCGLIFQSESIEQSKMIKSYKEMVTYVDNLTKPSKSKIVAPDERAPTSQFHIIQPQVVK